MHPMWIVFWNPQRQLKYGLKCLGLPLNLSWSKTMSCIFTVFLCWWTFWTSLMMIVFKAYTTFKQHCLLKNYCVGRSEHIYHINISVTLKHFFRKNLIIMFNYFHCLKMHWHVNFKWLIYKDFYRSKWNFGYVFISE